MITKFSVIYSTLSALIIALGVAIHLGSADDVTGVTPWEFTLSALRY